jgi:hypothetical protein
VNAGGLPELALSGQGGELVQSMTYREAYFPMAPAVYDEPAPRRLTDHAPGLLRSAVGGAWAVVSIAAAGAVLVVLVLVVVRIVGVLA